MSGIGQLTSSFFSGTNENTLALANFNVDISLVKLEAPKEFLGLGSTLSTQRRTNAEDGPIHKTLRRLGCLFEQIIPLTPKLIKAYGLRSSEIIQAPGISPKGSKSDGPFEAFVGADGTSIWAAATSGPAAMGVHLLACMLARQFDDAKVSTAIWVEIVLERQREIQDALEKGYLVSVNTVVAARQDITRDELAIFDASARSWLCSGDEAMMSNQKKLMLILKNINVPISSGPSTYRKVIDAWKEAMTGFEDLLNGMPQQVSNGAILRALSSWYLYPNLIVLVERTIHVKFEDPLLPEQSVITVGLQFADSTNQLGIQWSLALSHLRYYGDPVLVETNENNSYIDIYQLHLIAFGSLLQHWEIVPKDSMTTALWFHTLWNKLEDPKSKSAGSLLHGLPWLSTLVTAAKLFIDSQAKERETAELLINFGRRRGKEFLSPPGQYHRPFFGLGNPCVAAALTASCDLERGIEYYRVLAQSLGGTRKLLIVYTEISEDTRYAEFATAVKHLRISTKRLPDGSFEQEFVHARWIFSEFSFPAEPYRKCRCQRLCYSNLCSCKLAGSSCGERCHTGERRVCQAPEIKSRIEKLRNMGEEVYMVNWDTIRHDMPTVQNDGTKASGLTDRFYWSCAPALYERQTAASAEFDTCSIWTSTRGCQCLETKNDGHENEFRRLIGGFDSERYIGLFYENNAYVLANDVYGSTFFLTDKLSEVQRSTLDPAAVLQSLSDGNWHLASLGRYLELITSGPYYNDTKATTVHQPMYLGGETTFRTATEHQGHWKRAFKQRSSILHSGSLYSSKILLEVLTTPEDRLISLHLLQSLWALSFSRRIYEHIPNTTIPLRIVEWPLHIYDWISPKDEKEARNVSSNRCSRAQVFACIATFESGGFNVDPYGMSAVMAISSRNSIFVAGVLLSDPADFSSAMDIRRVVGNVGQPGITLMVSPPNLLVKPPIQDFRAVTHAPYDYKRINKFSGTSLHLSFTKWRQPLTSRHYGIIDQDIFMTEAVVSVRDSGRWVADIDVLAANLGNHALTAECNCHQLQESFSGDFVSIDSWEELLDPPLTFGIVRAHGNWAARLAAVCVWTQKNKTNWPGVVDPKTPCIHCLERKYSTNGRHLALFVD